MVDFKLPKFLITITVIVILVLLSLYFFYNPEETLLFPKCPFYLATGLHCPGCGSQRAFHNILNGNILEGLRYNYLLLLVFSVLIYNTFLYYINKFSNQEYKNIFHNSKVTISILVIVILYWILRNIPIYPFTELAP